MDFCKLLLDFLKPQDKVESSTEVPEALLDPSFISFFLNYVHIAAAKLCEQQAILSPPLRAPNQEERSKNPSSKRLSNKKTTSHDRVSTPKQRSDVRTHSPSGQAKSNDCGPKRNRKSRGKSPLVKQGDGENVKRQSLTPVSQPRRVALTQVSEKHKSPNFDLSSANEFPSLGNESAFGIKPILSDHKKVTRRIKPTLVTRKSTERCQLFPNENETLSNESKFGDHNVKLELQQERKRLLQTRIFSLEKATPVDVESKKIEDALEKQLQFISPIKTEKTAAELQLPSQPATTMPVEEVKRLATLYVHYIASSSVASVAAELHLLVAVLVTDGNSQSELPEEYGSLREFVRSPPNLRYFASNCLCRLAEHGIIALFSNETLSLLQANVDGKAELKPLVEVLANEINIREQSKHPHHLSLSFSNLGSVPFKVETDDKSSFPTEKAFYGFRKQRDMFYSLMQEWRDSHDLNASSAPKETVGKIRWLVTQVKALSTYSAFLRLFVDHMLSVGTEKEAHELADFNNSALHAILGDDPEKRRRLENRVSKPSQPNTSHEWLFKDFQFFRDFLAIADNYSLNVRLCDVLCERISEIEAQNSLVDETCVENGNSETLKVSQIIMGLRICGNFYGYVTFYPHCKDESSRGFSHIERSAFSFLSTSLQKATRNGHLFLTLPWVAQFLCFLPSSLLAKEEVVGTLQILHSVSRINSKPHKPTRFNLFLNVIVGYLFEQESISSSGCWNRKCETENESIDVPSNCIDNFADYLITHELLYDVHWKLCDINNLLKSRSSALCKRQLPKKIKPSTERLPDQQNLQAILEANFFRNQSLSLKRTVTFVAERCQSNCIKHICTNLIPNYCDTCEEIQRPCEDVLSDKKAVNAVVAKIIENASKTVKHQAIDFNSKNVQQCMELLVSSTVSKQVLDTAQEIAERQSTEMISNWLRERLFDLLASKIKQSLAKQADSQVDFGHARFSVILHELREQIIKNQQIDCLHESSSFENSVNCIKTACGSLLQYYNDMPSNIKQSTNFLISQILMQLTKGCLSDLEEKLSFLRFTATEISVLRKCVSECTKK